MREEARQSSQVETSKEKPMPVLLEQEFLEYSKALIDERLNSVQGSGPNSVSQRILTLACRHLCISEHAKRVRPLLCLYYHWMLSQEIEPKFTNVGVAAEFIHAASLLHDDIIDEAKERRGKPSVNHAFGNATAVLAGDFLLTEAFLLLLPFDRALSEKAIYVVREMTKAAILEMDARGKIDVTLETWRTIALGKTGSLFSWCGYAVGHFLNSHALAEQLWHLGNHIGVIFQLADDLKDFDGDHHLKDVCRDIRNLESNLPVILAIHDDARVKQRFAQAIETGSIDENQAIDLCDLVMQSGAIAKASELLDQEMAVLLNKLAHFDESPGKRCLERLIADLIL